MSMSQDGIRVLLVEDSSSDAQLLCEALRDYPLQAFDVERVERLGEAVALLARGSFEVILLDLHLPDSRGMETCARMARAAGQVPIIVLTGADDETTAAEVMRFGVQDYLVKGQTPGSVIGRTIRYAVERNQSQQALRTANERLQQQAEELQTQTEELQAQAAELTTANEGLRKSEQALHETEERLHLAMESGKVGVWEWEPGTDHVTWSQGFYRLLGYEPGAITATQEAFRQRIHPQDRAYWDQALRESLERCDDFFCESRVIWADGSVRWVEARGQYAFIDDENGTMLRMRGVLADVDRRKQAEEALRELNATLESKVIQRTQELEHRARQLQKLTLELSEAEERERQRLAELLHDDLQQVLAAAKFHVGLMKTRAKSNPAVQAAATQIDQMLKDAIEKSRSLSHELSPAVLHHGDFAETLGWLARQVQAKHGLQVRVDAFGAVRSQSDALKAFLYRAAQELLFNVVKHAGVSEARIRVRRLGRFICLSVSDRGRGFDPQEIRETAGFGLLSIRERMALLGGRMSTHSAKGRGATFHIIMPDGAPCGKEAATEQGPSRYAALDNRGRDEGDGRLRVLLVDDHEIVRQGVASLLSEEPAIRIVGEAANGREAVDLANRLRPDVVVMDVSMPVMSGDEATRLIKKDLPQTRVVALSMHEQGETVETMRRAGAERYVLKTAPSEELIAAICGRQVKD